MDTQVFTALPDILSKVAKEVLFKSQINERTGLVSWPRVMLYSYYDEFQTKLRSPNPPMNETSYNIEILNLEAYEYLTKTGWVHDEKHTGKHLDVVDNRVAPRA